MLKYWQHICLLPSFCLTDLMVTFVMSQASVQEGDDVILSCYVERKGLFDILRVYRMLGNDERDVISNNDVLKNEYVEKGRHEILAFSPDRTLSFIKIKINSEYFLIITWDSLSPLVTVIYTLL